MGKSLREMRKFAAPCWGMACLFSLICGCSTRVTHAPPYPTAPMDSPGPSLTSVPPHAPSEPVRHPDAGWTERVITEDELADLYLKDPQLTPEEVKRILARLNIREPCHIGEDIRQHRPMKVPNDFRSYRNWSPLPKSKAELKRWPKSILVVKNLFYLGWYEHGQLAGSTMACLGMSGQETQAGVFPVLEKDSNHYSRSYNNSYGQAAWMPWALRIYEAVWIHAGDVTSKLCSHGCVTLPLDEAESLFQWADAGTPVIIVESLEDLRSALNRAT